MSQTSKTANGDDNSRIIVHPDERKGGSLRKSQCLILDMDETLVHTFENKYLKAFNNIINNLNYGDIKARSYNIKMVDCTGVPGMGEISYCSGITRPHFETFIRYVIERFDVVIIWSAGVKRYVEGVINSTCAHIELPNSVFHRQDCQWNKDKSARKPISYLLEDPELKSYVKMENTFIIDDLATAFDTDNKNNGILIAPYIPSTTIDGLRANDESLLKLIQWFSTPEVMNATDVRTLDKSQIFSTSLEEYNKK